ncbi:MAG: hypothetical protein WC617_03510 [Rhodanobacter sp.]
MRMKTFAGMLAGLLAATTLQGCAGTAQIISVAQQQSLQSLPLFRKDGSPRFSLELACNGEFVACNTTQHAFERWASARGIDMQMVPADAISGHTDRRDAKPASSAPYRLAIEIAPLVVSSYNKVSIKGDDFQGGYTPPKVGYRATLYVFDVANGMQLREIPFHDEDVAKFKTDANVYLRAELADVIGNLDPRYRFR